MTLREYIEKREQVIDNQLEKVIKQDTINTPAIVFANIQMTELELIKVALEDGEIEGI